MYLKWRFWCACTLLATLSVEIARAQSWQWTRQRESSGSDCARAVAVSVDGQVYVAGYTDGGLDGQSSSGKLGYLPHPVQLKWGVAVDKAKRQLEHRLCGGCGCERRGPGVCGWWTRQSGSSSDDIAVAVAVSVDGQVYVAGYTDGSLHRQSSSGSADAFLMQYSSSGVWQWTRQRGSSSYDSARAVAVSVDGQVYVAGFTEGSLDGQSSSGSRDTFLMQYSSSGEWQWTRQRGSSSWDQALAVAVSVDGQAYLTGSTDGPRRAKLFRKR
eukprot:1933424-Amphidinium_carterae.2